MTKFRKYIITTMLAALAMVALYGCGAEPTATPAPPTDTPAPPTAAATDTPMAAEPTATTSSASGSAGSAGGAGTGTGTLTGPVADLLAKSQQSMQDLKSYHFNMKIEQAGTNMSINTDGDYVAPDSIRMEMGGVMGITETIETIIVGDTIYTKQPGTDQYMEIPGMSGAGGINTLKDLNSSMSFAQYAEGGEIVGDENVEGVDTTHVRVIYDVDKAMQATGQEMGGAVGGAAAQVTPTGEKATADIWIAKNTNFPVKVVFVSKAPSADPMGAQGATTDSTVTILYSKINEPVSPPIEKPANTLTLPGMVGGTPGIPGMPPGDPAGLPPGLGSPVVPSEMGTPVP